MMNKEEPLLNYNYNQEEFFCHSCRNHKPMSAIKHTRGDRLWCISCFEKMIENKQLSEQSKKSYRFLKANNKIRDYQQGKSKKDPRP